jgi:hypothetical protein
MGGALSAVEVGCLTTSFKDRVCCHTHTSAASLAGILVLLAVDTTVAMHVLMSRRCWLIVADETACHDVRRNKRLVTTCK